MTSSIYPRDPVIDSEIDTPLTITNGGANFQIGDVVVFDPPPNGITATGEVDGLGASDTITSINVTNVGSGYTFAPNVTVTSATGTGAIIAATVTLNFGMDENIFVNDVSITPDDLRPGGGGILRLYFSFVGATAVRVFNNGNFKGFLNADNSNTNYLCFSQGSSFTADSSNIFPTTSGNKCDPVANIGYMSVGFPLGDAKFSPYNVQGSDSQQINENTDEELGLEVIADKKLQDHQECEVLVSEAAQEDINTNLEKSGKRSRGSMQVE